ncbi:hypothetical protein KUTeg_020876 [Tegillarca granosa]|uniref:Uncharacterized protein n=1 Tax=Tegillarca granosa TaxID=220873 RepID=A0ABQ9EBM0_TEGGR|nr:hypothetical protein KUTeg_020876 [Tegillarca granosa]
MSTKSSDKKSSVSIVESTDGQQDTFATQLFRKASRSKSESESIPSKQQLARRRSTFKGLATTIKSIVNMKFLVSGSYSLNLTQPTKPFVKMENTYRMDPDSSKAINSDQLYRVISETLEKRLKNEKYDAKSCGSLTCDLSTLIKQKVKRIEKPRYKYVCQVIAGQRCNQGMQVGSRCVWKPDTDTFQQVAYSNNDLFVVVTVFAVYFE